MIDDMINESSNGTETSHKTRLQSRILILRNILNIVFMLVAIVGVIIYMSVDKEIGMYIVLISIPFKITESAIRMLRI